ncbi:MAG TPA: hypothetical protein VLC28_01925 [Flavitalea sp.]|nr:hypothetical protein [Flavitalea sp.]
MFNDRHFTEVPEGSSFELLFRWGDAWTDILVFPVHTSTTSTQYLVRLAANLELIIHVNEYGEWEEMHDGVTELARHLGTAIQTYCSTLGKL